MNSRIRILKRCVPGMLLVLQYAVLLPAGPAQEPPLPGYGAGQDVVLFWNQVMLDANAADHGLPIPDQGGPCKTSRAFAIVSVAVFDTVNSITHRHSPYRTELVGYERVNRELAVSKAAQDSLIALYPQQADRFRKAWDRVARTVRAGTQTSRSIELGRRVAARILDERAHDNSTLNLPYQFSSQPGYHRVDPLHPGQGAYVPHWGFVDPFVIHDIPGHLSPPPPSLNSPEYALAVQEVEDLGGDGDETPTLRTQDQTVTGIFWGYDGSPKLGTPPRLYNQVVRELSSVKRLSVEGNARLFALVNLAMADAAIQAWYTKYYYELWRPVIAIQNADADSNPLTTPDPLWTPLGAPATNGAGDGVNFTPAFPSYPSGHATIGTAALTAAGRFFGTKAIRFRFMSDEFNGTNRNGDGSRRRAVMRTYKSLDEAILENSASRVYLGVHFSFDCTEGMISGERIANEIADSTLLPRR